jgi:large subunit ribosomal protein L15
MGKKKSKNRGSRLHGRGKKKGRGAGIRGGRGNAGVDGHRQQKIVKEHGKDYFGSHGFNRPQKVVEETVTCNVGDLGRLLDELDGVEEDGDTFVVDLGEAGVDKLLGGGRVHRPFEVRVPETTDKAIDKVEAEGGEITVLDDGESEEDASDEPSDE